LKEILRKYKESLYRISRGLYTGKIDKSRLYRFNITGDIFCWNEIV